MRRLLAALAVPSVPDPAPESSIPGLAVRGYRSRGLQQVDLFWTGSPADPFDVYRDGRRIATVSASGYTDRLGRDGSGSYRYRTGVTGTAVRSNEATVTFAAGRRVMGADATSNREPSRGAAVSVSAVGVEEPFRRRAGGELRARFRGPRDGVSSACGRARRASARKTRSTAVHGARRVTLVRVRGLLAVVVLCLLCGAVPAGASGGTSDAYLLIAADARLPGGLGQRLAAIGGPPMERSSALRRKAFLSSSP